ncbi:MAG: VOC family protein [Dysgonamonadaceae bacterium]|jgi:methylmalonyl-CoA/ethylmalonyl-CoA epimerase|nr:VOC family protein [Dysgonamonadaceae bacterium]
MLPNFRFHHIGYAVYDIEKTAAYYTNAGWQISEIGLDKIQNTKITFLSKENMPLIELIAPVDNTSPIVKTLEKVGVSTYHICYEVDEIQESIVELRKQKFIPLFAPVEAVALENCKICYLYNKNVGLIEIVERK